MFCSWEMACKASGRKKSKHCWRIQILVLLLSRYLQRGVAQSGSASALGAEGRRFESCHPDQIKKGNEAVRTHFLFAIEHNGDDEELFDKMGLFMLEPHVGYHLELSSKFYYTPRFYVGFGFGKYKSEEGSGTNSESNVSTINIGL